MTLFKHLTLSLIGRRTENITLFITMFLLACVMTVGTIMNAILSHEVAENMEISLFLEEIGTFLFVTTVGTVTFVLFFLALLSVKKRFYEIGVYLSLGRKRMWIILQIFLELQIPGLIALVPAYFLGVGIIHLIWANLALETVNLLEISTLLTFLGGVIFCTTVAIIPALVYVLAVDTFKLLERKVK